MNNIEPSNQHKKSVKKKQSFPGTDIGSPRVPLRKNKIKKPQSECLSDWEHAS